MKILAYCELLQFKPHHFGSCMSIRRRVYVWGNQWVKIFELCALDSLLYIEFDCAIGILGIGDEQATE